MDSSLQSQSPDNSDAKPSFRKPANDATNRKYRRRSPISGSPSSSSGGSPKHGRSRSPNYSKVDSMRTSDDRWRRKDDKMDLDRDSGRIRSGKGSDSYKHSERQSYRSSRDYHRHDDYSRHDRHADDEERGYQRSSRSGRESRGSTYSDHVRKESDYDRSRENWRNHERYPRDRSDDRSHRNKDKERETAIPEHHRHNDKDFSDRTLSGMRQGNSNMDEIKMSERERNRDGGGRDDKRDHRRSTGDYKYENASSQQEVRVHEKDLTKGRDSGASRSKESHRSSNKEPDRPKEDMTQKRKHDDRDNNSSSTYRERDAGNDKSIRVKEDHDSSAKNLKSFHSDKAVDYVDDGQLSKSSPFAVADKPPSSSHQVQENVAKSASANEIEASNDLNAAKVAAMKAAELVNRNLVGGGYMSTDQKRKLLWGNKKNTAAEESGNLWGGMPLFSDRERQEKFNKLMVITDSISFFPIQVARSVTQRIKRYI
eukprot:TRINITY_DN1685_c0_g2_i1.p1 TRINITY_DN1685_c0_g2~~TRINITY_DN1685_c0_g2_i1.p1  ORF type:complete len:483 (-),score=113.03 TRINITY_DN1685_c0_g2_i1:986-2434(-)